MLDRLVADQHGGEGGPGIGAGSAAPDFSLPSTDGGTVSLAGLRGENDLLYFSEGVGCDPCFTQMLEIEANQTRFDDLGVTLLPVMVNPAQAVAAELARFGLQTPVLVDATMDVSRARHPGARPPRRAPGPQLRPDRLGRCDPLAGRLPLDARVGGQPGVGRGGCPPGVSVDPSEPGPIARVPLVVRARGWQRARRAPWE